MRALETDLCILGGGAGGLSVAAGAAQMGARVVLLEPGPMGGDCLNTGCVPSKALRDAARLARLLQGGTRIPGIPATSARPDFAAIQDHVRAVIARIAPHDSQERFESLGVTVIRAPGRFVSARAVETPDTRITARRFVIATGARPVIPPLPGLDTVPCLTHETIFDLRTAPGHLLILGGGPVGLEMAQAHRRLGSAVTVITRNAALSGEDPELAAIIRDSLRRDGVELLENTTLAGAEGQPGAIRLHTGDGRTLTGTHLLIAAGRRPDTAGLGLGQAGIATTPTGAIRVDNGLRTGNRRAYAIGDVTGLAPFTHVAGYHAGLVVRAALLGLPVRVRHDHLPHVIHTDPELAHVGLTEARARTLYDNRIEVIRVPFADNDRAVAQARTDGLIKLVIRKGRPVGVSIAGPGAGEAIHLWALALANRMRMRQVAAMVAPYPTLGEIGRTAAGRYYAQHLFESSAVKTVVRLIQRWLP
ncbi:dihydrolipoyl dehydrogenase family protein [Paracoccus sp. (in: a-proteobacteria)]|uniref:dihydrolipoyl dehydrogenase family protein n=1 Tax=Paracoccus sp. TaxID=267 RepID=UPI003A88F8DC